MAKVRSDGVMQLKVVVQDKDRFKIKMREKWGIFPLKGRRGEGVGAREGGVADARAEIR